MFTRAPLVCVLRQMHPDLNPSYFFNINFSVIPFYVEVCLVISFLQVFTPKPCMH
jgi:hypothetical protein